MCRVWRVRCCLEVDICFGSALLKGFSIQHVKALHELEAKTFGFVEREEYHVALAWGKSPVCPSEKGRDFYLIVVILKSPHIDRFPQEASLPPASAASSEPKGTQVR